jgi:hypothetical protein
MKRTKLYKILFWFNIINCLVYFFWAFIMAFFSYKESAKYLNDAYSDHYSKTDITISILLILNLIISYKIKTNHSLISTIQLIIPSIIFIIIYGFAILLSISFA